MKHEEFSYVNGATFSGDERRILSWGNSIRIWDAQTGKQLGPTMKHVYEGSEETSFIRGAVFSRDERAILAWGSDGYVRLWDAQSRTRLSE